jgi:predicted transposase YbfD/YdcC
MLPDPRPYFSDIRDPRRETKNKLHKLGDILMIVFCSVLSGIEDWVGMETFAEVKEDWLRQFLELPNGIPSHDTLSDVMGRLEPGMFAEAFLCWTQSALPSLEGEQVCIDGKTLRGSRLDNKAVHVLTAYAAKGQLVLTQMAVDNKTNEITAIPEILSCLDIKGAVVTIDAMGCQKNIAAEIIQGEADYVLALKDNHPQLCEDAKLWLDTEAGKGSLPIHETLDKNHGRIEIRRYTLSSNIDWLSQKPDWSGLQALGRVESTRIMGDKTSTEYRYYLLSLTDINRFAESTRNHWSIENSQHWVLDVQFNEDKNRARIDHSAENLALVRRMALNVLRKNKSPKYSIRQSKTRAAINDGYRFELIFGSTVA